MTLHTKVSGAWKEVAPGDFHVRVSGTWKEVQEGWVRISGSWKLFFQNEVSNLITLTCGNYNNGLGSPDDVDISGYDGIPLSFGSLIGSRTPTSYTDGGSNSRTVILAARVISTGGTVDEIWLGLSGTSIPNTDTTFKRLTINGVDYVRSAATYDATTHGHSVWIWSTSGAGTIPSTGSQPIYIVV